MQCAYRPEGWEIQGEQGHFAPVFTAQKNSVVTASKLRLTRRQQRSHSSTTGELLTSELFISILFDCSWNCKRAGGVGQGQAGLH